jgi:hypothetical protein
MTPGWEKKVLGAPVTFVGMYEAMDVIVLAADLDEIDVSLHLCAQIVSRSIALSDLRAAHRTQRSRRSSKI